ncbi:MAG: type IV toxin-antitoxin system AbiEi family antitoxin domain-containing protein [Ilumatobacteraceae bacterium]
MPTWQHALDEWFRTHHGIATNGELLDLGLSQRTIGRMVADGRLITMQPGVFRSAQWPASTLATMRAACARNPHALVGITSACAEWGLRRVPDLGVHLLVPHGSSPELRGVTVHRCRTIDEVDRVERPDGIRLTSPPRSLFDSADLLGLSAARSVTEQLIHEGMSTIGTIADTYTRLRHPGRPGSHDAARAGIPPEVEQGTPLEPGIAGAGGDRAPGSAGAGAPVPDHLRRRHRGPRRLRLAAVEGGVGGDDPAWHAGSQERHRDVGCTAAPRRWVGRGADHRSRHRRRPAPRSATSPPPLRPSPLPDIAFPWAGSTPRTA